MRVLGFDSKEEALQAVDIISSAGLQAYINIGYSEEPGEGLTPKNMATGQDDNDATKTKSWDVPWQIEGDNQWLISHPANKRFESVMTELQELDYTDKVIQIDKP